MKASVLSTSLLDDKLVAKADQWVTLSVIPFIDIKGIADVQPILRQEIKSLCGTPATAIFTSANAVRAIAGIAKEWQPEWNIYCIGKGTRNEVESTFTIASVAGMADDGATLAETIKINNVKEAIFFCGNLRLERLPVLLKDSGIALHEYVVYETKEAPVAIEKDQYDAILFFSPSAVHSFFSINKIEKHTVLFAIGNTTARAVKDHTDSKIVISNTPSKEQVIADAIQYFSNTTLAT